MFPNQQQPIGQQPAGQPVVPVPAPATLPQVDFQTVAAAPQPAQPAADPAAAAATGGQESTEVLEKLRLLTVQYSSNPYAFNAAFQQLKAQYLLERYHIDANTEKN